MRSPLEAKAYLTRTEAAADLPGSLRLQHAGRQSARRRQCQSAHPDRRTASLPTPIVEVKNMNSFRAVERALAYEAERQYEVWQETRTATGRCPEADARLGRPGPGDQAPNGARKNRATIAIFPIPIWCRSIVTRDAGRGGARRSWANCRPPFAARLQAEYELSAYDADVLVNQGRQRRRLFRRNRPPRRVRTQRRPAIGSNAT